MSLKILLLGYFGFTTNKKDGQTVKTRQCLELLQRNTEDVSNLNTFDTEILHAKPWLILNLLWKTVRSDKVIYLPAQNNLYYFFPILYVLSKIFHFDIVYLLIGGWLPVFLEKHPRWVNKLRKIKAIFPENKTLTALLQEKYGLQNVHTMPNFRFVQPFSTAESRSQTSLDYAEAQKRSAESQYIPKEPLSNSEEFRLVFMSRIVKEKGIETVFQIADYFSKPETRTKYPVSIDFYGEISSKDKDFFYRMLPHYGLVQYKGVLPPNEITRILCEYDTLILPTRYPTEGVPGAIIDAYMAGIPVIVSDWVYSRDVVEHEKTGYIVSIDSKEVENYIRHIEYLSSHPQELLKMKAAAREQATKYDEKAAWAILKPFLS